MRRVSEDALDADNDWTADPQTGRSNSSPLFLELVTEVERIIRSGADTIVSGRADTTARVIVAQLAHVHGMRPHPAPEPEA